MRVLLVHTMCSRNDMDCYFQDISANSLYPVLEEHFGQHLPLHFVSQRLSHDTRLGDWSYTLERRHRSHMRWRYTEHSAVRTSNCSDAYIPSDGCRIWISNIILVFNFSHSSFFLREEKKIVKKKYSIWFLFEISVWVCLNLIFDYYRVHQRNISISRYRSYEHD